MHRFGYSEIKGDIPADIMELVKSVHAFSIRDADRERLYSKEYEMISRAVRFASVKYSNEIEGIRTTDDRLEQIVMRGGTPKDHPEEELAGYARAVDLVNGGLGLSRIDGETLKLLHSEIRAGNDSERGQYKRRDNAILEDCPDGSVRLVFAPVSAEDTGYCMEQLFLVLAGADSEGYEPLLLVPCVILDYLCIHPFADGNGRTSRLLTMILLYRYGINICRYVSLDEYIAATKNAYYQALAQSSDGWKENEFSYFPFIRYFLRTLYECYIDLDTRFAIADGKKLNKKRRVETVLSKSLTPLSKRQIGMMIPDVSAATIDAAVKELLAAGRAEKVGTFRDARYRIVTK